MEDKVEVLQPKVGDVVVYVDPKGQENGALVTAVWPHEFAGMTNMHGVNLVLVSRDESRQDPFGRQIERFTSVIHKSGQPAPGNYWKFAGE